MSAAQQRQRQAPARAGQATGKMFSPTIDIEQVVLDWMHNIGNSAIFVASIGDAKQANVVFTMGVLNLDSFVFSLLTSDESRRWTDYRERRQAIVSDWPQDPAMAAVRARKLYELTVAIWAKQRLFKVRRHVYFGEGWERAQELDVAKMQDEEEKDTVESDDV